MPKMKFILPILAVMVLAAMGTSAAMADTVKVTFAPYQSGSGGEFNLSEYTNPGIKVQAAGVRTADGSFQSFCVEKNEFISNNTTYDYRINGAAIDGGRGGPSPDPLSDATRYLYAHFWNGTLTAANSGADYRYSVVADRLADAIQLQNAFWALEEEDPYAGLSGKGKTWYDWAVEATDGDGTDDDADWAAKAQGVAVMNLWDKGYVFDDDHLIQSQLVMVPLPAASLTGIALLGLVGLVGAVRRRRMRV